jgi:hypothetical protein
VILSILIGHVSTHDTKRILETLEALRVQSGSPPYEVIIADRRLDAVSEIIRSQYAEVRVLPCAVGTSPPELRTLAFESSRGEFIVMILHKKKFSFRLFAQQRFLYSQYHAGMRCTQVQLAAR